MCRFCLPGGVWRVTTGWRKPKRKSRFEVTTKTGSFSFDSEGKMLIYRLLPVSEQIDPDWADDLRKEFGLEKVPLLAVGDTPQIAGAVAAPGQEQLPSTADMQAAPDAHRMMQVGRLAASDPEAAVQIAKQITDPTLRVTALATAAPGYQQVDPQQANAWLSAGRQQLDSLPSGLAKLRLKIALIKAAIANGDREAAKEQIAQAYDFGAGLFEADSTAEPGKLAQSTDGFDELVDLTDAASRQTWLQPASLENVRRIRPEVLRAHLLVEEAKGIADSRSSQH